MTLQPPPIYEPVSDPDGNGVASLPYILFFNQLFNGDQGSNWPPGNIVFNGLTAVGTPTFSGRYYTLSSKLIYFAVQIVPGTNTSSTAGTTYIDMTTAPFKINGDGACLAVSGGTGTGAGHAVASSNRIYVPGWVTITNPITIVGLVEAS